MSDESIIIPANPYIKYAQSNNSQPGNVEAHRSYANKNKNVFWDLYTPGKSDARWTHPEITSGYFYIAIDQKVRYRFRVGKIARIGEFEDKYNTFVPPWRQSYWPKETDGPLFAILMSNIRPLKTDHDLCEFALASTGEPLERVQNYAIVRDPGFH